MASNYPATNHPAVRQSNRAAIFRAIYESTPIARVDLAERTGLNDKTVSRIVAELIAHGLTRELGYRESSGAGRKAVKLEVDPTSRYAIGVDIAGRHVTAALVDLAGDVHERVQGLTASPPWPVMQTIPAATEATERLLATIPSDTRAKIVGIGIGAPSRFKLENGSYLGTRMADTPGWVDLHAEELERHTGLPVTVDNNANTSALAELWFGNGKGVSDFVLLNLSAGIGMGIVVGGEVHRGGNHHAGEAGHITVDANGPRCECGNIGCLSLYVSQRALRSSLRAHVAAGESSVLTDNPDFSLPDLIAASHASDPVAETMLGDVIRYLAAALNSVMSTYDPQMILLGRQLATAGERFFDELRASVLGRLNPTIRDDVRIEPADVNNAPIIGAATLALRNFFRAPLDQPSTEELRRKSREPRQHA